MDDPTTNSWTPLVLLLTNDEAGITTFPGILLPNDRVLVRDLPFERLNGICPGEIVVIPPVDTSLPIQRVRPEATRAQRDHADSPTVLACIKLAGPIADVQLPATARTQAQLEKLLEQFDGDMAAGLTAHGLSPKLFAEQLPWGEGVAPVTCIPPEVHIGLRQAWSICDWLGFFC